jgi:hypothetical protein
MIYANVAPNRRDADSFALTCKVWRDIAMQGMRKSGVRLDLSSKQIPYVAKLASSFPQDTPIHLHVVKIAAAPSELYLSQQLRDRLVSINIGDTPDGGVDILNSPTLINLKTLTIRRAPRPDPTFGDDSFIDIDLFMLDAPELESLVVINCDLVTLGRFSKLRLMSINRAVLPPPIFSSLQSLEVMRLLNCEFPDFDDGSSVVLPSLLKLHIDISPNEISPVLLCLQAPSLEMATMRLGRVISWRFLPASLKIIVRPQRVSG